MEQRRVTVFGGSGFLGRYVVERLADRDDVVMVAVRDPEAAKFLKPLGQVGQIVPVRCDIRDEAAVATAVANADVVISLVGVLDGDFEALHVESPGRIAKAAAAAGVGRMIHVSALGADTDAPSAYLRSKARGEAAVREAFPNATIVRPSIMFGPEDGFFNMFGGFARLLPALPLFGGGTTRFQPVYVGDVATAMVNALGRTDAAGRTYSFGGPAVYSFAELMRVVLRETRRRRLLVPVPAFLGEAMAALTGWLPMAPVTLDQMRSLRVDNVVPEGEPGLAELGVQATALEVIVPTYLHRYRRGGRIGRHQIVDRI